MVAEATLMQQKYVSLIDVLHGIGWLDLSQVNLWKNFKILV